MSEQRNVQPASPYFSIVIPAYNEQDHIESCLQAIFSCDYDNTQYEVIVVDNGSQDETHEIALNSECARVFQLLEGNVGAVRNYGAMQARGQILVFIDADCIMDRDWLNRAEKLIKENPNCAYGGGVKLPGNATWIEKSWLLQKKGQPTLPKHMIGASTIVPKELFMNIKGFDELVSSGEDTDLHYRLTSANVPVLIDHALDITHLGNAKTPAQFIQRQIWHSENYVININQSLKDPIFLITVLFIFLPILAIVHTFWPSDRPTVIIILIIWSLVPALLSVKRLSRAHLFTLDLKKLLAIYSLDFFYLTGRSLGFIKGILKLIK